VGDTHLEIAILGWTPRVPGSWPIHSWSPWRSSLTDLSLLKPRSEISWPIPDTLQPTSETTWLVWLLCVDLSNPTIARDSLVPSTKHRKKKRVSKKQVQWRFPKFQAFQLFGCFYTYDMHLNYPTPRFDWPGKSWAARLSGLFLAQEIIGQIIGENTLRNMGFWWDSSMISFPTLDPLGHCGWMEPLTMVVFGVALSTLCKLRLKLRFWASWSLKFWPLVPNNTQYPERG